MRQGDVADVNRLILAGVDDGSPVIVETPAGVAILSQTCDIVQPSKTRCLVAPVIDPSKQDLSDARKGRKPLLLYLESEKDGSVAYVADMERATSVPKALLAGRKLLARCGAEASEYGTRIIAARVGRAFSRFPFPDEVYPVFKDLRGRVQTKSGTESAFGKVIDLVTDLRVSADQWAKPGRRLTLYVIVPEAQLIPIEDTDPNWEWDLKRIRGLKQGETGDRLDLDRVSTLILQNSGGDATTLAKLWAKFGQLIQGTLLRPSLNREVISFEVEVLSDVEMSYQRFSQTESLDLDVLSGVEHRA
nr:hypothetical protein [Arthrobacter sp. H16F315]